MSAFRDEDAFAKHAGKTHWTWLMLFELKTLIGLQQSI
jgi:hypothetical protein